MPGAYELMGWDGMGDRDGIGGGDGIADVVGACLARMSSWDGDGDGDGR